MERLAVMKKTLCSDAGTGMSGLHQAGRTNRLFCGIPGHDKSTRGGSASAGRRVMGSMALGKPVIAWAASAPSSAAKRA
jgi:hypothetical protein